MNKWETVKLSDMFDLQMGKTPSRDNPLYWDGNHKWVSIADLGKASKYIIDTKECISDLAISETGIKATPPNTVVMSFKLSIGKTAVTSEEIFTNEAIMSFIDKGVYDFNIDYVYHLFSGRDWTAGTNKAVMGITLNKATLSQICIPLPPIDKQCEIAENLNKITHTIDLCNSILEKLDLIVKSQFVEMFGNYKSNSNNFKVDILEKHIDVLSGYPFESTRYVENGINICGGLIIMPQVINWKECKHWRTSEGYEVYLLENNDIVMALDRPWISEGFKIAKVDEEHLPALLIQRTARIRATDIIQEYLYHCFLYCGFDEHCNITGSLVPHISVKDIKSFSIMIPPLDLQNQFADFVQQVDKSKFVVYNLIKNIRRVKFYDQF